MFVNRAQFASLIGEEGSPLLESNGCYYHEDYDHLSYHHFYYFVYSGGGGTEGWSYELENGTCMHACNTDSYKKF